MEKKMNHEQNNGDAQEELMKYFEYEHLPPKLQEVSKPFCELAKRLAEELPSNGQRRFALQMLLVSKDAAVRASL